MQQVHGEQLNIRHPRVRARVRERLGIGMGLGAFGANLGMEPGSGLGTRDKVRPRVGVRLGLHRRGHLCSTCKSAATRTRPCGKRCGQELRAGQG